MIERLLRVLRTACEQQLQVETGMEPALLSASATGDRSCTFQLHTFDEGQPITVTVTVEVSR